MYNCTFKTEGGGWDDGGGGKWLGYRAGGFRLIIDYNPINKSSFRPSFSSKGSLK